jgi:two-component system sensor histidine kinase ArlS
LLNRWGKDDPVVLDESLKASLQELTRFKGLVQDLLELSRAEKAAHENKSESIDPEHVTAAIIKNMEMLHPEFTFDVELGAIKGFKIMVARHHFEQILLVFLDNAVKYSAVEKIIRIVGSIKNAQLEFEIKDSGIGIPEADLPYIFDRLYQVNKARSGVQGGHGLGLSIAQRLIEAYGGTVAVTSLENKGTQVNIRFPV